MGLWSMVRSKFRRPTSKERILRQCRTTWAQHNISEAKIAELCDELEDSFVEAEKKGYGPEAVVGKNVREFAEEMVKANAPPRRWIATAYKMVLIALVSTCAVLAPQHVLLGSWAVPVGWTEISAILAIFSTISLLQWHKFSSITYNGRKVDGVFFAGDAWAFTPGILIGVTLQVYDFKPAATQVLGWPWWASLTVICLALLTSRLHRLSTTVPISPIVGKKPEQDVPSKSDKVSFGFALAAVFCNLTSWLMSDGLLRDWSALMLIASSLLLAFLFQSFGRRESAPSTFE